jgi:hypothetical protein
MEQPVLDGAALESLNGAHLLFCLLRRRIANILRLMHSETNGDTITN